MAGHSFQEVMRQLNRMCKAHPQCEGEGYGCPLYELGCCGNIGSHCSEPLQVERIEKTVMQWAAEHPEPVYPTWKEWFIETKMWQFGSITDAVINKPIPADIAEKLGIEPKEGV